MRRGSVERENLLRSDASVGRHLKRQTRLDPAARGIHDTGEEDAVRGYTLRAGSGRIQDAGIGVTDSDALLGPDRNVGEGDLPTIWLDRCEGERLKVAPPRVQVRDADALHTLGVYRGDSIMRWLNPGIWAIWKSHINAFPQTQPSSI